MATRVKSPEARELANERRATQRERDAVRKFDRQRKSFERSAR